ncbi:hypothetical protein [Adhaeribacter arboris]|uniref:hypothetical protein n=1 Tax=Adhaeribacter arboris TaxID=2072846 RepID=UPI001304A31A|nr:hypothetical protein [Adhaeribacter arboris]
MDKISAMKARQSKTAKNYFSKETQGRAILKSIQEASSKNAHVIANLKINSSTVKVKEL